MRTDSNKCAVAPGQRVALIEGRNHGNDAEMVHSDKECKWSVLKSTEYMAAAKMVRIDGNASRVCLRAQFAQACKLNGIGQYCREEWSGMECVDGLR